LTQRKLLTALTATP